MSKPSKFKITDLISEHSSDHFYSITNYEHDNQFEMSSRLPTINYEKVATFLNNMIMMNMSQNMLDTNRNQELSIFPVEEKSIPIINNYKIEPRKDLIINTKK